MGAVRSHRIGQTGRFRKLYAALMAPAGRGWRNPPRMLEPLEERTLLSMTLLPGFADTQITSGLSSPIAMAQAPDGRIFVTEQAGDVRIIQNGQLLATPFLTLQTDSSDQRGLLGIALDPNFEVNHYVYVYYTALTPTDHQRISRFVANGNVAGPEQILVDFPDANVSSDHMAGEIYFGLDGDLYVNTGDQDVPSAPQSLTSMWGKVLRFNSDGSIPTSNPFYTQTTGEYRAIYAIGFRNPFTAAVNPVTGTIFVNDVGGGNWEEVDQLQAGGNYGWPLYDHSSGGVPGFVDPIFEYSHNIGQSITGGAFYVTNNPQFPASYDGTYFIGDWAVNGIMSLNLQTLNLTSDFATGLEGPINLIVGIDGGLYYLDRGGGVGSGSVHEITATNVPEISLNPTGTLVSVGTPVTFTAAGAGAPPLTFQWLRNNVPIPNATSQTYTIPSASLADDGAQFALQVTNPFGINTSTAATLHVTTALPPTATIIAPIDQSQFSGGTVISYSGLGTDPQDGTLPASAYSWQVELVQDGGVSTVVQTSTGPSGTFTVPTTSQAAKDVDASQLNAVELSTVYRFVLTVTDSAGLTATASASVNPTTSHVTLATSIPGLLLTVNGMAQDAPYVLQGIVGFADQTVAAPTSQVFAGVTYNFTGWSQGGAASQTITFPGQDTTYTADYVVAPTPVVGDGLLGSYYSNETLTGTPVTRIDPTVNMNLSGASPGLGLNPAQYSIQWTGQVEATYSETYTFYFTSDDGSRMWVNGVLLVDQWYDHGPQTQSGTITLAAGQKYSILIDYYQNGGGAQATLEWSSPSTPRQIVPTSALFSGGVNPNPNPTPTAPVADPTGLAVTSTLANEIDLSWTNNATDATGFLIQTSADGSTNWTQVASIGVTAPQVGVYTYNATGLAAATQYYFRVLVLRNSDTSDPSNVVNSTTLAAVPTGSGDGLLGSYYNDSTLTGTPVTRVDAGINFYLVGTAPMPGISSSAFSVQWTGQVEAQYTEPYTFYFTSDDGSRMWVNGQELVNQWYNHDLQTQAGTLNLVAGQLYTIMIQYYQAGGNAGAKLEWSSPSTPRQVIPQSLLFSGTSGGSGPVTVTAPSGLMTTNVTTQEIDLAWTNNQVNATGFVVQSSPDGVSNWTQAGTTGAGVTTFQATGLGAATTYYYRVLAEIGATLSNPSNVLTAVTGSVAAGNGLLAQYFDNETLSGTPITQVDNAVNFSLPDGTAPLPSINPESFSVRWTGSIVAPTTENYTFYLSSDDGSRLWINGVLVLDLWWDHDVITGAVSMNLVAGQSYDIKIEYYQNTGNAVAKLEWATPTIGRELVPTSALFTTP